jgi:hypothetical protein
MKCNRTRKRKKERGRVERNEKIILKLEEEEEEKELDKFLKLKSTISKFKLVDFRLLKEFPVHFLNSYLSHSPHSG